MYDRNMNSSATAVTTTTTKRTIASYYKVP